MNNKLLISISFTLLLLLLVAEVSYASSFSVRVYDWPHAIMGLFGGITFLLYGLSKLTRAFRAMAGDKLRIILDNLTKKPLKGLAVGGMVTAIVQSSTAVTVMVIGFVSAKLLTLSRALPIMIGADIGTTITVQLIAFKFNQYALILITVGFLIKQFASLETTWHAGRALMSLGMIFFGIFLMSESMGLVRDDPFLKEALTSVNNPFWGILVGFTATAVMQSSAASIGIMLAFASQGLLSLESSLYLVLGANIGTCLTVGLVSLKTDTDGQRVALANILFKAIAIAIILALSVTFADSFFNTLMLMDPRSTLESAQARHIAHIHTGFNIFVALLFMPLLSIMVPLLRKIIKRGQESAELQSRYLDASLIKTPSLALNAARLELVRVGRIVAKGMHMAPDLIFSGNINALNRLRRKEKRVDVLYKKTLDYLAQVSKESLTEAESRELTALLNISNRMENIADLIGLELYELGRKRVDRSVNISAGTSRLIRVLFEDTHANFKDILNALNDKELNENHVPSHLFSDRVNEALSHQATRLTVKESNRINTYALEVEIVDKIHRMYHHCQQLRKIMQQRIESKDAQHALK